MVELPAAGPPLVFVSQPRSDILKTANVSLHPVAKGVELQEISCKTAHFPLPHGEMSRIE
jgi:hypothetical protein